MANQVNTKNANQNTKNTKSKYIICLLFSVKLPTKVKKAKLSEVWEKNVKKVLLFSKSWNLLLLHVQTNPYYSIQKKGTEKTYGQITKC